MTTLKTLEDKFFAEQFDGKEIRSIELKRSIDMVKSYVEMEQCVAVLSDLAENRSYIFTGAFGDFFGMEEGAHSIIDSIWEDDIYKRIDSEDLFQRHLLELEYYNFLKPLSPEDRLNYSTQCQIRARDQDGKYHYITHRSRYLKNSSTGGVWLDICLYNYAFNLTEVNNINGQINNAKTGESININTYQNCSNLLTVREKEVLQCVKNGLLSKEIALRLKISIYTVNRHRQNILDKLKVNNSMEAVRTATGLNLIN